MALPISATPVLKGKEALKFAAQEIKNRKKFAPLKDVREAVMTFADVCNASWNIKKGK